MYRNSLFAFLECYIFLLFVIVHQASLIAANEITPAILSSSLEPRELRAASLTSGVAKRKLEVPLHYDFSLHYLEGRYTNFRSSANLTESR